ncbi:hypothetical protein SKAU_G00299980 [Synaphobranchus kaupii]|uniref:Uncharacterized protein n=1 Tax=Synaphobranchus kaupii TaxID=118154 RepID=A0A9Q1IL22_SYNKA|nr:hypothetical protein SKAU_G00299980 [Synaphobranchus kaupii]
MPASSTPASRGHTLSRLSRSEKRREESGVMGSRSFSPSVHFAPRGTVTDRRRSLRGSFSSPRPRLTAYRLFKQSPTTAARRNVEETRPVDSFHIPGPCETQLTIASDYGAQTIGQQQDGIKVRPPAVEMCVPTGAPCRTIPQSNSLVQAGELWPRRLSHDDSEPHKASLCRLNTNGNTWSWSRRTYCLSRLLAPCQRKPAARTAFVTPLVWRLF